MKINDPLNTEIESNGLPIEKALEPTYRITLDPSDPFLRFNFIIILVLYYILFCCLSSPKRNFFSSNSSSSFGAIRKMTKHKTQKEYTTYMLTHNNELVLLGAFSANLLVRKISTGPIGHRIFNQGDCTTFFYPKKLTTQDKASTKAVNSIITKPPHIMNYHDTSRFPSTSSK